MPNKINYARIATALVGLTLLFLVVIIFYQMHFAPTGNSLNSYTSRRLHLHITIPNGYNVNEGYTHLKLDGEENTITISRVVTNHTNITQYINDLVKRNNITLSNKREIAIDHGQLIAGTVAEEPIYFLLKNGWVYTFTCSSSRFLPDLDTVVRSFEYVP